MLDQEKAILKACQVKFPTAFHGTIIPEPEDMDVGEMFEMAYVATHDDPRCGISEGDTCRAIFYIEDNTLVDCVDTVIVSF